MDNTASEHWQDLLKKINIHKYVKIKSCLMIARFGTLYVSRLA